MQIVVYPHIPLKRLKHIMVATDFSPSAWTATKHAIDWCAESYQVEITLIHVIPEKQKTKESSVGHIEQQMDQFISQLRGDRSMKIVPVVKKGSVQHEVLKYLSNCDPDLIMIGINGNGGMNNLIGKNALGIIQGAGKPIMILPSAEQRD